MSLTLINKPIGHRLNTTDVDAQIIDDGQGNALVYTGNAHGLSDGDYVYIDGNIDSYNGFKYVDSISYDSFKIKNSEDGDLVEYVQDADISYRTSVLNHGWQSVHLPIVYELESDLWPNNTAEEAYVPNTIASQENSNGNTKLNLINAITPDPTRLNFIELVGTGPLAGPYQILQVDQDWAVVINLAYDAANVFTPYQVVNYYNNYAVNVNVYAGLPSDHRWVAKKPFELAATLKFTPDSDGRIRFSVADILKGYIITRNNLTLDTLPNNLDFHVQFYISYFESYDQSNGTTIETFEGEVTTDTFEGHAVNSMMPFKSLNSGHMSDYVNQDTFLARWLTLFDRPMAFVDRFFDISFLNRYSGVDVLIMRNGVLFMTITNPGAGVIRVMFIPESGFSEYCLQAISGPYMQPAVPALNTWTQVTAGSTSWTTGANPSYMATGANQSHVLRVPYNFIAGLTYEFNYDVDVTISGTPEEMQIGSYSGAGLPLQDFESVFLSSSGNKTGTVTIVATAPMSYLAIRLTGAPSSISFDINSIAESGADIGSQVLTEVICIDITNECSGTFSDDVLRITEGAEPRILE